MSELRNSDFGETPTLEVRALRNGAVVRTELCESEADAAALVEAWEEERGIECEVDDLSVPAPDGALEIDPALDDDYPRDPTGS